MIESERAGSPMKAESPLPADDNKELEKKASDLTDEHTDDELEKVCLSVCLCLFFCLFVCLSVCSSVCLSCSFLLCSVHFVCALSVDLWIVLLFICTLKI